MPRRARATSIRDAEVKLRVTQALKDTVIRVANDQITSESELFRAAMVDYLRSRGIEIKESPEPAAPAPKPVGPVRYRLKKGTQRKILDTAKKHLGQSHSPSQPK